MAPEAHGQQKTLTVPTHPRYTNCLSEQKLQAELHYPRRPGAAHFADTQVVRISATGTAEGGGAVVVGGPAATRVDRFPLGVIEGVERLPPELQSGMFGMEPGELEVFEQRYVPVIAAGAGQHVASHIAKHAGLAVSRHLSEGGLGDHVRIIPTRRGPKLRIVIHSFKDLERPHGV